MDVVAHGLWGAAIFGSGTKVRRRLAFLVGVMPDIVAFGPFVVNQIGSQDWVPFPRYVHQTYDVTHSLVVCLFVTGLVWFVRRAFPWALGAWALHICCDIPTHSTDFFPTPYLWPFPTAFHNGVTWARPAFMISNYAALLLACLALAWIRRKRDAVRAADSA